MTAAHQQSAQRLDAVEVKVTIGRSNMDRGAAAFGLNPGEGEARRIYFCESPRRDAARLPLLDQGLILRLREKAGEDGDSTVKFRPFNAGALSDRWRHDRHIQGTDVRVEADWVGDRHVVAASAVAGQRAREVAEAAAGARPLSRLLSRVQEEFLEEYAAERVDLDRLRVLGPINATKWKPKNVGLAYDLAAERWEVGNLEFLEMSIRVEDPLVAPTAQQEFVELMGEHGLLGDLEQETKTRAVLEYLSRRG